MAIDTKRHLISIDDLSASERIGLLDRAEWHRTHVAQGAVLQGRVVALLFLQPSTRTRVGFQVAAARLGGSTVEISDLKYQTGMDHAESLSDTVRVISDYCDIVVLRHSSSAEAENVTRVSSAPIINGGSGEHHPTQALIDLYAIRRRLGRLDGLRIGFAGDLKFSRSAQSVLRALRRLAPKEIRLMAPASRGAPAVLLETFDGNTLAYRPELQAEGLDVLYMAGLMPGLGTNSLTPEERAKFRLTEERLSKLPDHGVVLCPLPRIDEIDVAVDASPKGGYFVQSADGLFVRMAVLEGFVHGNSLASRIGFTHSDV